MAISALVLDERSGDMRGKPPAGKNRGRADADALENSRTWFRLPKGREPSRCPPRFRAPAYTLPRSRAFGYARQITGRPTPRWACMRRRLRLVAYCSIDAQVAGAYGSNAAVTSISCAMSNRMGLP